MFGLMYFGMAVLVYLVMAVYLWALREVHIMYNRRFLTSALGDEHWFVKISKITLAGNEWDDAEDVSSLMAPLLLPVILGALWPVYLAIVFVGFVGTFVAPYLYPRALIHKVLQGILGRAPD